MRPSVSIIGAGRVGIAMALALQHAGYRIDTIVTESRQGARRSAKLVGPTALALTTTQLARPDRVQLTTLDKSRIIIIATPDDKIESAAEMLSAVFQKKALNVRHQLARARIALHTSGALSSRVLRPLSRRGFAIGSLHPLLSISDPVAGASLITQAFFAVEGDALAVRAARNIVNNLGGHAFTISKKAKPLYHAAALTASPLLISLFDIALELMSSSGVSRKRAQQMLLPLVNSTLANLKKQTPQRALTGPFKRGDIATIQKHIAAMKSCDLTDARDVYAVLGRHSLKLANTKQKDGSRHKAIAAILSGIGGRKA